jgi:Na+/melibiose symporter-like transporter
VFAGLINQAKSAVSGLVLKYVARASVAIPFVIAAGFALAAGTVMLVERFGQVTAYWAMAGGLAAIGVIAALVVSVKEHEEEKAEQVAEKTDTSEVMSDAAAQAAVQAPIALLGTLLTTGGGASSALSVARVLGRNLPLVVFAVLLGALFWPTKDPGSPEGNDDLASRPNGADSLASATRH